MVVYYSIVIWNNTKPFPECCIYRKRRPKAACEYMFRLYKPNPDIWPPKYTVDIQKRVIYSKGLETTECVKTSDREDWRSPEMLKLLKEREGIKE